MIESIETLKELDELIADDGYLIYCEEDKNYYRFKDGNKWEVEELKKPEGDIHLSVYEMNKQILSQLPVFNDENWLGAANVFSDWMKNKEYKYYMLYGREISYFTLFHQNEETTEFDNLFDALCECLEQFDVKAIDVVNEGAVEIWVDYDVNEDDKDTTVMYLFPYDDGVIYYG